MQRSGYIVFILICIGMIPPIAGAAIGSQPTVTVLFYLNGDNNLSGEVLHALDMIETVGSSPRMNLVALVDGHPRGCQPYGSIWSGTHLVHVQPDPIRGRIASPIIESYGERNLGLPQTLSDFVHTSLQRFPADRYILCVFAHGKGIINTDHFSNVKTSKSLSISSDDTDLAAMSQNQFADALRAGLGGERFDLMVMFACLTNMVEIAYSLADVTHYLVGSEDEIRLLNEPPGHFQLRGIRFEDFLAQLKADPAIPAPNLARNLIDRFIEPYRRDLAVVGNDGGSRFYRFSAGLSLIDCHALPELARGLDRLAGAAIRRLNTKSTVIPVINGMHAALSGSQNYHSFMNLEYYDLGDLLQNWQRLANDAGISRRCRELRQYLESKVILYEQHTADCRSNGMSIYLSNYLIPENIYQTHQRLYSESRFSRDTGWGQLIDVYRRAMKTHYPDILIDESALAYARSDLAGFERLGCSIIWSLRHQVQEGRFTAARRYVKLLESVDPAHVPIGCLNDFQQILEPNLDRAPFAELFRQVTLLLEGTAGRFKTASGK